MTHGPTKVDSKGECIYCAAKNVRLTDEHILPYFIGGFHVISDASCDECAKITSKFEGDIARGFWGDARISYSSPSRRKYKRKKYIFLPNKYNPGDKLKIPYSEYPAPMIFYEMGAAGFLLGRGADIDVSSNWKFKAIVDQKKLEDFEKRYPGQLTATIQFNHDSFARLIAKIGYGQIMFSLDPGDFRPICLPYILGENSNLSYVVGSRNNIPPPIPGLGYEMMSISYGTSEYLLLIASIRIIASSQTPVYHVVVGDVSGKKNVSRVREKLIATCTVVVPDGTSLKQEPADEHHWMPRVWPLPKPEFHRNIEKSHT